MMKRTHGFIVIVVSVFALSLNAVAQPLSGGGQRQSGGEQRGEQRGEPPVRVLQAGPGIMGMGPGGPGGVVGLLQNPELARELARELGLTPEQTSELRGIMRESANILQPEPMIVRPDPNTIRGNPQTGPIRMTPEEVRQRIEEGRQRMEAGIDAVQEKVDRVLKPEQREKLRDVAFQLSGGLESPALGMPMGLRVLETLTLTDEQKEQFRKLVEERNTAMREMMERFEREIRTAAGQARVREESGRITEQFVEQIKGILTPEQTAKVEKLTAETPALRARLRMPEPGGGGRQLQPGGPPPPPGGYVPGQDAWRPGQAPPPPQVPRQPPRGGGFPRGEN